ncbi:hypothetical protein RHMOL_Rhmol13G0091600 [Rhododendron molle]|uniref:Uncharacterized protein n=1 Tax=Rhododendron molle TaxID=49168 RepID=A0ACC0L637_RHOML|nr:hypothetical protein RHMOL_Rhmol13G0091600 [Rhododendron molle]
MEKIADAIGYDKQLSSRREKVFEELLKLDMDEDDRYIVNAIIVQAEDRVDTFYGIPAERKQRWVELVLAGKFYGKDKFYGLIFGRLCGLWAIFWLYCGLFCAGYEAVFWLPSGLYCAGIEGVLWADFVADWWPVFLWIVGLLFTGLGTIFAVISGLFAGGSWAVLCSTASIDWQSKSKTQVSPNPKSSLRQSAPFLSLLYDPSRPEFISLTCRSMSGGDDTPADRKVISLKLLVDKARNRVIFAESDHEFVDILLSFLTLPIGSAVRLLGPDSTAIGSLTTMYNSVASLESRHLRTDYCKDILLNPRNAAETQCSELAINVYPLEPVKLYECNLWYCSWFSTIKDRPCRCKHLMSGRVKVGQAEKGAKDDCEGGGVFVKDGAFSFMITDDLQVMAGSTAACLSLFQKFGIDDGNEVEERTLEFGEQQSDEGVAADAVVLVEEQWC